MIGRIQRFRDLTLLDQGTTYGVVACDSCGGVGEKPLDRVSAPPEVVGYFTGRVALLEVLSVGATPVTLINTVSCEMEPTGRRILAGLQQLLKEAELPLEAINGSTEENFAMEQTAMGVTVIGTVDKARLKARRSLPGDRIGAVGLPKMGGALKLPYDEEICSLQTLRALAADERVREIIPAGSKGMGYEARLLAQINHCEFAADPALDSLLAASAGPATAAVFSVRPEQWEAVVKACPQPVYAIGKLNF